MVSRYRETRNFEQLFTFSLRNASCHGLSVDRLFTMISMSEFTSHNSFLLSKIPPKYLPQHNLTSSIKSETSGLLSLARCLDHSYLKNEIAAKSLR